MRNIVNDTLTRLDDNLVTNEDPNNQLKYDNFTKDWDHERATVILTRYTMKIQQGTAQDRLKFCKVGRNLFYNYDCLIIVFVQNYFCLGLLSELSKMASITFRTVEDEFLGDGTEIKFNTENKKLFED